MTRRGGFARTKSFGENQPSPSRAIETRPSRDSAVTLSRTCAVSPRAATGTAAVATGDGLLRQRRARDGRDRGGFRRSLDSRSLFRGSHRRGRTAERDREPLADRADIGLGLGLMRDREPRDAAAELVELFELDGLDQTAGRGGRVEAGSHGRVPQVDDEQIRPRLVGGVEQRSAGRENDAGAVGVFVDGRLGDRRRCGRGGRDRRTPVRAPPTPWGPVSAADCVLVPPEEQPTAAAQDSASAVAVAVALNAIRIIPPVARKSFPWSFEVTA